ncbi:hypothetical protein [Lagierella sp.]|uniref:hypothetical protein n=1 Tax=Lagierella sp. TaxID=2849657 RepID=UPI00262D641B|nr:hypothetical protein [Lagierella sp.]
MKKSEKEEIKLNRKRQEKQEEKLENIVDDQAKKDIDREQDPEKLLTREDEIKIKEKSEKINEIKGRMEILRENQDVRQNFNR